MSGPTTPRAGFSGGLVSSAGSPQGVKDRREDHFVPRRDIRVPSGVLPVIYVGALRLGHRCEDPGRDLEVPFVLLAPVHVHVP